MAKASTQVRKVKEPQKRGHPPKKQSQPPSGTQAEHPPSQEVISKTKPQPQPIPPKKSSTLILRAKRKVDGLRRSVGNMKETEQSEMSVKSIWCGENTLVKDGYRYIILTAATVPGGSSSAPDIGAAVATLKSTDFDENTATALLLGLAWPVGDLEVPDPVGKYSIEDEDFFQNLKASEAGGLDDEYSQSGDEEEFESEDSAEDNEEPESDEDVIDIPLHVPVNGVLDTLTVKSNISWDAFHRKIAKAMEISLEDLSIAYKFSTDAKTDSPHKLDSARNLFQLLGDASEELSGATGRSRKKKFMVDIVDIQLPEVSKGESKKGTLTSSKTKARANKRGKADDEDSDGGGKPADAVNWDDDTDVAKLPPPKIVVGLQMKYACAQHQGCCFVMKNGDHHKIPLSDISHWVFMIVWNKFPNEYNLRKPPPVLKIEDHDAQRRQADPVSVVKQLKTALSSPANGIQPVPEHVHQGPANILMQLPAYHHAPHLFNIPQPIVPHPFYNYLPPVPASQLYYPPQSFNPYSNQNHNHFARQHHLPGPNYHTHDQDHHFHRRPSPDLDSDIAQAIDADNSALYPLIPDWLQELDRGPWGDNRAFARDSIINYFHGFGYKCLFEIIDPTLAIADKILEWCPDVSVGTAKLLETYARKDCEVLKAEQMQHLRHKCRRSYY
ncbi:hypothetical protein BDR06DRAFT_966316 [Suillus hirtellus]|nr:hypothetical protein BDR06DRAFT_966316 [Suillus hirtellus]